MNRYLWLAISFVSIGALFAALSPAKVKLIESEQSGLAETRPTPVESSIHSMRKDLKVEVQGEKSPSYKESIQAISPIDRLNTREHKTELHRSLLKEHKSFKRYPPENVRFETPSQDPVSQRYAIDERSTLNADQTYGLTIWSERKYYLQGETVHFFAFIQNPDGNKVSTQLQSSLIYNNKQIKPVSLTDEDGDGIYQGTINLADIEHHAYQPGIYKVLIQASKQNLADALTFTLSQPDIQLTGEIRDYITAQGHLNIEVEIEATQNNRFYFQASLYGLNGTPIGVTQASHTLTSGKHWIPLTYAGLMIRDSNEMGPYILKQISLAKLTMPMQRAPALFPEYQTKDYDLEDFSNLAFEEQ